MKPSQLTQFLALAIRDRAPVLVTGAPGVGKSDIIAQATALAGADLIISHPVVSDPTDFKGLPFAVKGQAEFLPFGDLRKLIEATKPTVFFLDDLGQAPPAVQAACMQLLLARRINGHAVADVVTFLAATNRRTDRAGVQGLLEPVKSRFASIVTVEPDLEDWIRWALRAGLPTELIAFVRYRPSLLHDFHPTPDLSNTPSPRTVANVGKLMLMELPQQLQYEVFSGAAGEGFAAEFIGFLRVYQDLPNPDAIILDPDNVAVPSDPATLWALTGALSAKASPQNFERLVRYYHRMPAEFSVKAMLDSVHKTGSLVSTRAFVQWASDHSEVLV